MKLKKIAIASLLICSAFNTALADTHWGYSGETSPDHWGKLNNDYYLCEKGFNQSPIDITNTIDGALPELNFTFEKNNQEIINNGHTIQVNTIDDIVIIDGNKYQLQQFHAHKPSENTIDNKQYPIELHFVHAKDNGEIAVIGVMVEEGKANEGFETLLNNLPKEVNNSKKIIKEIDISDLYPSNKDYYRFSGSLTTPPCSEGIIWIVMKTPITATKQQIEKLEKALGEDNNRPIQPLHGRVIIK
ncbi:carbonic anhydrase [Salmonella enterica]|nr:carbonic anhydrase family protein [Salmonella enterica]